MYIQITLDHNDDPSFIARVMAAVSGIQPAQIVNPAKDRQTESKQDDDPLPKGDNVGAETAETQTDAKADEPKEEKKPGRPKKTTAAAKSDEPKQITEADLREAIRAVAKKAGAGSEVGGIAKVEEILGQFGVAHVGKVPAERLTECYQVCQDFLAE